jgi:2-methylisocitrate lyase-like PEP mutase family enzyme
MNEISTSDIHAKAELLKALHHGEKPLVLPNAWDIGTAIIAAEEGFPAIATTSAGVAFALGLPDGEAITLDEMAAVVGAIANRVNVPVTADMEAGYGDRPENCADTVRATISAGAVGLNLEDGIDHVAGSVYDFDLAVERIQAAREAADQTGIPIVINARTDVYFSGTLSPEEKLIETVRRCNAFLEAGADCAFVIGPGVTKNIPDLVKEIDGPLNIVAGFGGYTVNDLAELGVSRISLGGMLSRATLGYYRDTLKQLKENGRLDFSDIAIPHGDLNKLFS